MLVFSGGFHGDVAKSQKGWCLNEAGKVALTMHMRLLETFPWSKVKISCHLRKRRQIQKIKQKETVNRDSSADDLVGIFQD